MKLYKAFDEEKLWRDWIKDERVIIKNNKTFRCRIKNGFTNEEALTIPIRKKEKPDNWIGKIYNNIKIEKIVEYGVNCKVFCICLYKNCNKKFETRLSSIKKGLTKSCGCYQKDRLTNVNGKDNQNWKGYGEISLSYFHSIKFNANSRNKNGRILKFEVTIKQIWELFLKQNRKCALSGLELKFGKTRKDKSKTASLDRINPLGHYTIDNIQWVHKDLQDHKFDRTNEDYIKLCHLVSAYNKNK